MFYDRAKIYVKGGDGGNGVVAFRREKYVPEGGPNGGDGGRGGSIYLVADPGLHTLADFRYRRHYKADRGEHGKGKNMHGKNAEDLYIRVPLGTVVIDETTGQVLGDLTKPDQVLLVASGGRGGRGNARFVSPGNRVPTLAEKGEPGEERWLLCELKLLADVGLIGFPNAGKSTIISRVSAAKPKIANYPFTTLVPNLGVVDLDQRSFVIADIPGLIAGAHAGAGLGHEFLRHIERTRLLIHVIDTAGSEGRDPVEDFVTINEELRLYNPDLATRPQIVAANKMDLPEAEMNLKRLAGVLEGKYDYFPVSAVTGEGLDRLMARVAMLLDELPEQQPLLYEEPAELTYTPEERFVITPEDGVFVVSGKEVERHFAMTDFNNEAAVRRFQTILQKMGVEIALREHGAKDGDVVRIKDLEFELR